MICAMQQSECLRGLESGNYACFAFVNNINWLDQAKVNIFIFYQTLRWSFSMSHQATIKEDKKQVSRPWSMYHFPLYFSTLIKSAIFKNMAKMTDPGWNWGKSVNSQMPENGIYNKNGVLLYGN